MENKEMEKYLLTDEEVIVDICGNCMQENKWSDEDCRVCRHNMESACQAQHAKTLRMLKEEREKVLKEVGEWLEHNSYLLIKSFRSGDNLTELIGMFKQGKLPEGR